MPPRLLFFVGYYTISLGCGIEFGKYFLLFFDKFILIFDKRKGCVMLTPHK